MSIEITGMSALLSRLKNPNLSLGVFITQESLSSAYSPVWNRSGSSHHFRMIKALPSAPVIKHLSVSESTKIQHENLRSAAIPQGAHDWKPNQVQCRTWLKTAREENPRRAQKTPSQKAELFLWNPATSYSPGRFSPCCIDPGNSHGCGPPGRSLRFLTLRLPVSATGGGRLRSHRAARDGKPSQVQCTLVWSRTQKKKNPGFQMKNPRHSSGAFIWNPATSYSPGPSPAKYHRR